MIRTHLVFVRGCLALCALLILTLPAGAAERASVAGLLASYEQVRQALVVDDAAALERPAAELLATVEALRQDFDAAAAGVPAGEAEAARALLAEIAKGAQALDAASGLEPARDAFYELSKPLVRYRAIAEGEWPEVAYCSMAKKSWLQPAGEIGNPYYGRSMQRCGELVEG